MSNRKIADLTYERAIEILRYEPETGVLERKLKLGRWKVCGDKPRRDGYGEIKVDGKLYLTHRLIWLLEHGSWPEFIDHKDRDRMNNKISNLRDVTRLENDQNKGMHRDNPNGYPGVSFHKASGKYQARIGLDYKDIYLGLFTTAEEAFTARMLAKIKYHPTSPDAQQYLRELTLAG